MTEKVADEDVLIVDGFRGKVFIDPNAATQTDYSEEMQSAQSKTIQVMESARQPAQTLDGTAVSVLANVGCREDVSAAADNGAEGVGLYRLEQVYLSRKDQPYAAELLAELRATFAPMKGRPITVRLLNIDGNKPLPFLKLPPEDNPFLGQRGVRLLLRYPDLLDARLQSLGQFSQEHDVRSWCRW